MVGFGSEHAEWAGRVFARGNGSCETVLAALEREVEVAEVAKRERQAVLRAPRSSGGEALLLVAAEGPALAAAAGLLRSLAGQRWLAKDLVLLCLEAGGLESEEAEVARWAERWRGGVVHEALVLEDPSAPMPPVQALEMALEGRHARLPNLDLVNVAVRCAQAARLAPVLPRAPTPLLALPALLAPVLPPGTQPALAELAQLGAAVLRQASGVPAGPHAPLLERGLEALTMRAAWLAGPAPGRALECVLRSLSNLSEALHMSYWLYLLASPLRFTSIAYYVLPLALLLLPLQIRCLQAALLPEARVGASELRAALAETALVHALGLVLWFAAPHVAPLHCLLAWLAACLLALLLRPRRPLSREARVLAALLPPCACLSVLSLANFGAALLVALPVAPLAVLVTEPRLPGPLRAVILLLASPPFLLAFLDPVGHGAGLLALLVQWQSRHASLLLALLALLYVPLHLALLRLVRYATS